MFRHLICLVLVAALSACTPLRTVTDSQAPTEVVQPGPPRTPGPAPAKPSDSPEVTVAEPVETVPATAHLVPVAWTELPNWADDDHASALKTFLQSCKALGSRAAWQKTCAAARKIAPNRVDAARRFFEANFQPHRAHNTDGSSEGLITGYYEPLLHGSRKPTSRFRYPLYGTPDDLIVVDLADLYPELKGLRLRGRLDGRRLVPYYSRAQIDNGNVLRGNNVLFWVDDPIDLFFLQIQGSGQIRLDNGERTRVGYADQNGHPYRSIGRYLIERGELTLEKASMQGIKAWARQNPDKLADVLAHNARYVFFRELAAQLPGPLGALGVPLTAGRSLAIDPRYIPLGAPVYLATTAPNAKQPLQRLMLAQDTGGAIRGGVRGDYFWGFGEQAGAQAGRMRQTGRMWVLVPNAVTPENLLAR